ncbi:SDR family NAD(P)-dependent oxidoreductase [Thalassobacillus pellis]|uniref:SDR family NAD(P)-dependent oxidoreductase n=1 Tax=Thalassobacillus pellis TaxID=748008 RepID=UPI001961B242|nr:SDR family oxidoreductase [Thalassobacillus pellis]MBM7552381.1 short-subunit dehydrogenase [Thalassobacillus pellis]
MNEHLKGKKVLITGASSGIGQYLAIHVARNGGHPILVARSGNRLELIAKILKEKFDTDCYWYKADLTNGNEWKDVSDIIFYDHDSIDALINNAGMGIFENYCGSKWQDIERMLQVNVHAPLRITHQVLPHFIAQKSGHIINIASQAGKMATPKSAVYSATKHALLGFSNALRMEVEGWGILVTTVNLGPVRTNFFKQADPTGNYETAVEHLMLDANQVANRIVKQLFIPKREINLPTWMDAGSKVHQLFPSVTEKMLRSQFNKK